jgi:DNA invertase Pin-like site-specific DNA recombinase
MNAKIQPGHLQRQAVVYLRQSTLRQVVQHGESTDRQYRLRQRAVELGWTEDRIVVIDEDLGQSGSSAEGRGGFQRLADEVAHGRVGAIFALEASRLARRSADWHRLLDLCRLADVLIADDQSVYAPCDYNDQLLLGLKGTMAEAELVWMRRRLHGGKLNKARRGELRQNAPTGYVWDEARGRLVLDPDKQVRGATRLVFERFRIEGSARGVLRYFVRHGLRFPSRGADGEQRWRAPSPTTVLKILQNPTYAGAYVFGRTEERAALVEGVLRQRCVRRHPQEEWGVFLPGHHEGYIEWEEFVANQHKLQANRTSRDGREARGAARDGEALLQGLALCGRCGRRMMVHYPRAGRARYLCNGRGYRRGAGNSCWSATAHPIDEEVKRLFFAAVKPPELELGLAIAHEAERQAAEVDRQWKLRMQRLEYEARLAERRYKAVDPENRVVAATLERDWEQRLRDLEEAGREREEARAQSGLDLKAPDRARILALAKDLPALWAAKTTTMAERKTLLRLVVREVALSPMDVPPQHVRVAIQWETGVVSESHVQREDGRWRFAAPEAVVTLVREAFSQGKSDDEIAALLREREIRTSRGRAFDAGGVACVRHRLGLRRPQALPTERLGEGLYSTHGVAACLGVHPDTVQYWVAHGWLAPAERGGPGKPNWFRLDEAAVKRIEAGRRGRWAISIPQPRSKTEAL